MTVTADQEAAGSGTVRIVPLDPAKDAPLIHSWVTQDRARFWGMRHHTLEQVREIYAFVDSLDTHHAYLVHRGDRPVALFQTYRPEADPVGECYEVLPGDFGVHILVGPPAGADAGADAAGTEPGFTGALLTAFLTWVLDVDPARRRIVAEPDARNNKAIARFVRAGFVLGPEIELPEKRARLVFLSREDFEAAVN